MRVSSYTQRWMSKDGSRLPMGDKDCVGNMCSNSKAELMRRGGICTTSRIILPTSCSRCQHTNTKQHHAKIDLQLPMRIPVWSTMSSPVRLRKVAVYNLEDRDCLLQRESLHVARCYCRRAHLLLYDSHEVSQEVSLCNLYMKPEPTILDTRLKDLPAETENVT